MSACEHKEFNASVGVARLEDSGYFNAEIRVACRDCGKPFRFLGLKPGLDLHGAAVNFDGTEARIAIVPFDEKQRPYESASGFEIKVKGAH